MACAVCAWALGGWGPGAWGWAPRRGRGGRRAGPGAPAPRLASLRGTLLPLSVSAHAPETAHTRTGTRAARSRTPARGAPAV